MPHVVVRPNRVYFFRPSVLPSVCLFHISITEYNFDMDGEIKKKLGINFNLKHAVSRVVTTYIVSIPSLSTNLLLFDFSKKKVRSKLLYCYGWGFTNDLTQMFPLIKRCARMWIITLQSLCTVWLVFCLAQICQTKWLVIKSNIVFIFAKTRCEIDHGCNFYLL